MLPKSIGMLPHQVAVFIEEKKDNYEGWERAGKNPSYGLIFDTPYYSSDTITRIAEFFRELSKSLDTKIEILTEKKMNYVCGLCDNFIKEEEVCKYDKTRGRDPSKDEEALSKYNLSLGQEITVEKLLKMYGLT
jgi:hypothetical protein